MQLSDIWQVLGTPQLEEITNVASIVISSALTIILARKSTPPFEKTPLGEQEKVIDNSQSASMHPHASCNETSNRYPIKKKLSLLPIQFIPSSDHDTYMLKEIIIGEG